MKKLSKTSRLAPDDTDVDIPEVTAAQFRAAKHARYVEPDLVAASLKREHGGRRRPTKLPVSIRLSRDIVSYFKSTGAGWQTRIDDSLRQFIDAKT